MPKNVVLSTRVPVEFKEKLTSHLQKIRKPLCTWLQEAYENRLDVAKAEEEAYDRGYRDSALDLARLYLENEEEFWRVLGGLLYLAQRKPGRE